MILLIVIHMSSMGILSFINSLFRVVDVFFTFYCQIKTDKSRNKIETCCFMIRETMLYFYCKRKRQYITHRTESFFLQPVEYNEFYPAEAVDDFTIWGLPDRAFYLGSAG